MNSIYRGKPGENRSTMEKVDHLPELLMGRVQRNPGNQSFSSRPLMKDEKDMSADDLPILEPEELVNAMLEINLSKVDPGQRLGIRSMPCRGSHRVSFIYKGGMLELHNLAHPEDDVKIGDHIVDVNGVRGDHSKIKTEWMTASELCIKFIAATLMELEITKKANDMLGITTLGSTKVHKITSIHEGGAIHFWNARQWKIDQRLVQVGDYIVEVNGVRGDAEVIKQEWIRGEKVVLKVMAPRRRRSKSNAEPPDGSHDAVDG